MTSVRASGDLSNARAKSAVAARQKAAAGSRGPRANDHTMLYYETRPLKSAGIDDGQAARRSCKGLPPTPARTRSNRHTETKFVESYAHVLGHLGSRRVSETAFSGALPRAQSRGGASLAGDRASESCKDLGVSA